MSVTTTAPVTAPPAPGPKGVPFLGSLPAYRRDAAQFLLKTRYEYGPVSTMAMGPYTFTLATSPSAVQRVLIKNHNNYCRGQLYKQFELVMGSGLLTKEDEEWRPHRRVMQPAFLRSAMEGYFPSITEHTRKMIERWDIAAETGEPVELIGETLRIASAIIMAALFSYDIDEDAEVIKSVVDESIDIMFPHGSVNEMLPEWLPTTRNRRVKRNRRELHALAKEVVAERQLTGETRLLDMIQEAHARGDKDWTVEDIRDEILTIYLAGHETTATALCWAMISTANELEVRERLEAEVDEKLGDGDLTFEKLKDLPYTEAVISETLRMYPPIWLFPRDVVEDDVLDGYLVKSGTSILLSPLITHRDPEVWESPEAFNPDRFLNAATRPPQGSYIPFGLGGRQCVGNMMALMELQSVLAMITQRFRLEVLPSAMTRYGDTLISLRPMGEVYARVTRREGAAR